MIDRCFRGRLAKASVPELQESLVTGLVQFRMMLESKVNDNYAPIKRKYTDTTIRP